MLILEKEAFSVSLVPTAEAAAEFALPPYRKENAKKEASLAGRAAAGELFRLYYEQKTGKVCTRERLAALQTAVQPEGKPWLPEYPDFYYNISHSGGFAAAVWCRTGDAGIDLEMLRPCRPAVCRRCFSEEDNRRLAALSGGERDRLFTFLWTRREAMAKALGKSVFAPLPPCRQEALTVEEYEPAPGYCMSIAYLQAEAPSGEERS